MCKSELAGTTSGHPRTFCRSDGAEEATVWLQASLLPILCYTALEASKLELLENVHKLVWITCDELHICSML